MIFEKQFEYPKKSLRQLNFRVDSSKIYRNYMELKIMLVISMRMNLITPSFVIRIFHYQMKIARHPSLPYKIASSGKNKQLILVITNSLKKTKTKLERLLSYVN